MILHRVLIHIVVVVKARHWTNEMTCVGKTPKQSLGVGKHDLVVNNVSLVRILETSPNSYPAHHPYPERWVRVARHFARGYGTGDECPRTRQETAMRVCARRRPPSNCAGVSDVHDTHWRGPGYLQKQELRLDQVHQGGGDVGHGET